MMMREAVLHFLGVKDEKAKAVGINEKYCAACKKAKLDDCEHCDKNIRVLN